MPHRTPARRVARPVVRRLAALGALLLCAFAALPARADGLIVIEPHPPERPDLRNVPLAVKYHRVSVSVEGRVAVTDVDQVFVNHNPRRVEGTYLFPLPEGAAIDRFGMWVDGVELTAELLDAGRARGIYEEIVRRQQDPALLEYAGQSLFKARIFPIEPNSEKRVRIRYAELLPADNGTVAYRYPLNTEKFSSRPLENVSVSVDIRDDAPITAVFSPSHAIDVPTGPSDHVRVGWEARDVRPDRDFLLYWRPTRKDVGVSLVTYRTGTEPGTFLLVLAPSPANEEAPLPKDVVLVLDTSGSMAGAKMDQARAALRYCLRSLGPDDRFAVVPFATEPRPFRDALVPADAATRAAAEAFVDGLVARGGTAIDDALRTALGMLKARDAATAAQRPAVLLFVTDGLPTIGVTDADAIVQRAQAAVTGARVFAFGVGNDVNTRLLDRLALENRGARDYVAETESIEEKVSNLYTKLAKPALTDLELTVEGVGASAVHPRALGDLFHGSELLVVGRYEKPGTAVVRLRGKVRGVPREIVEELRMPETAPAHAFLPRLWAVRRVGFLLDEIRLHGETAEMREEVVRLAKEHGIVTPYTSYLILEDDARNTAGSGPRSGDDRTGGFFGDGGADGGAGGTPRPPEAPAAEAAARDRLRDAADDAEEGRRSETGKSAVEVSRELKDLDGYRGERDAEALGRAGGKELVRHVGGRTFVARRGVWWEHTLDVRAERSRVECLSDACFALLREHPWLAKLVALGNVVVEVDGRTIEFYRAER